MKSIREPPTQIEIAELFNAVRDYVVDNNSLHTLRRLLFHYDDLTERFKKLEENPREQPPF